MRRHKWLLITLLCTSNSWAIPFQPVEFMDAMEETEQGASISLHKIHDMVNHFSRYAREYPPKIDNEADHAAMVENVTSFNQQLNYVIEEIVPETDPSHRYFVREQARLGVIAHNLDIANAAQAADEQYQWLLGQYTGKELADIQMEYGIFLANSTQVDRAVIQLQAALDGGNRAATKPLALTYLQKQDLAKAQTLLETYINDYPDDGDAKELLAALKAGKVKVEVVKP